MTERKPTGLDFESWIDKQIREAQERGEFADLPGTGKPLPDLTHRDEMWWVQDKLAREGLSSAELLPTPVKLRKETHRLPDTVRDLHSEEAVRDAVAELNTRIKNWLRAPSGPQIQVGLVDADAVVERWRAESTAHESAADQPSQTQVHDDSPASAWRRVVLRMFRARRRRG